MSEFVPMTREELLEGMAALAAAGKMGGYCERHVRTALYWQDRAEKATELVRRLVEVHDGKGDAAIAPVSVCEMVIAEARVFLTPKEDEARG